ncbi:DUF4350 domain-containing protein [Actinotalea sp. Marseille-Q4924]|uniref:DUF4350 domain-containing protein n=1 Tax=Actinotalea sp. Marseille-Q4924 TaxID=2866571 RepID=UPI001CE43B94|nr:DUF4350 domain-containing protein [Actinotalea sp. Marseille-Q4924]
MSTVLPAAPVPPARGSGTVATAPSSTGPGGVMGDGTTARGRALSRWSRARWPLAVLGLTAGAAGIASLLEPTSDTAPFSPGNAGDNGSRAVARILEDQGVRIETAETTADVAALAGPGSTVLVVGTLLLTDSQLAELVGTGADLVVIEPDVSWHVEELTDGALTTSAVPDAPDTRPPGCDDPTALAAGPLDVQGDDGVVAQDDRAVVCWLGPGGTGAWGTAPAADGRGRVTVLGDSSTMTNDRLDEGGNAALVLRTLGADETLVWYTPSITDTGETGPGTGTPPSLSELLPAWAGPVGLQLLVVLLAVAVWRGRSLGPVVTEPLPVVVRAAETTVGRGRLYRRARSRGHAAAALRAGAARRCAARLGLPRSAGAPPLVDAVARATGRPAQHVADLLYGPPPTDDDGLLRLARQLDELESEVHRT